MSLLRGIALLLLSCFCSQAFAHALAPSLLDIRQLADTHYEVLWRTPRLAPPVPPAPVFPDNCRLGEERVRLVDTAMEWRWPMACGGDLTGQWLQVTGLTESGTAALLKLSLADGRDYQQLLTGEQERFLVPEKPDRRSVLAQYLWLGAEHILLGVDHLLFVTGLLLLARSWRQLLATVTAFTVGHSVTLALVSLNLIPHWPALVELAIALTILVLALELCRRGQGLSLLARYQWPMAAAFGLLHGLGFAGELKQLGLPPGEIVPALLAFNVGIELGQLAFVALLALLLWVAGRVQQRLHTGLRWGAIYTMGVLAVFWTIDRGVLLLGDLAYL